MKTIISLFCCLASCCMAGTLTSLQPVSSVEKLSDGWKCRIRQAEGVAEMTEPLQVKTDSQTGRPCMIFPAERLQTADFILALPVKRDGWLNASALKMVLRFQEKPSEQTMVTLFAKDNDHLWRQIRRPLNDWKTSDGTWTVLAPLRGLSAVDAWECCGHSRPWNPLTVANLVEIGLRLEGASEGGDVYVDDVSLVRDESVRPLEAYDMTVLPQHPRVGQTIEVSFRLTAWPSAPYDSAKTSVVAEIQPPSREDGRLSAETVHGFYFEDFLYDRDEWDKTRCLRPFGEPCYKIRYCPRTEGHHRIAIHVDIDGQTLELPPMDLDVQTAFEDYHGFIHCDPANQQFFCYDDGTVFFGLGMNLRSPYDNRYAEIAPYSRWKDQGLAAYERLFKTYHEHGINTVEVWMCSWWHALEWIPDAPGFHGLGQFNPYRAWMLDYIVKLAEENGIHLILVLNNHGKFGMTYDTEWGRNPYNAARGGFLKNCEDYFSNAQARKCFQKLLDYIVARWGATPQILSWKLFTEVDLTGPDMNYYKTDPALAEWHEKMGGYLKTIDIYHHPVTTHWMLGYHRIDEAISSVAELDFLSTDAYYTSGATDQLIELLCGSRRFGEMKGKPLVITEFGGSSYGDNMGNLMKQVEVGLWTGFFQGMGILPMYWWFALVEDKNLYSSYDAIRLFGQGEDRRGAIGTAFHLDGRPLSGFELKQPSRRLYWIYDEDYMYTSEENVRPIRQVGRHLTVRDLDAGDYTVEFWSPSDGRILSKKQLAVAAEERVTEVPLPEFCRSLAVKIIKRNP